MKDESVVDSIPNYPSEEYCKEIATRVFNFATRKGANPGTTVRVVGETAGTLRWARNQVSSGGETTDRKIMVFTFDGKTSSATRTNEATDDALKATVLRAEQLSHNLDSNEEEEGDNEPLQGPQEYLPAKGFHQATADFGTRAKSESGQESAKSMGSSGLMSFGFMLTATSAAGVSNTNKLSAYYADTRAAFSVTVRSRNSGSGWAGSEHEDIDKADMPGLIKKAIDKCRKSENPMRMEPGRHTVILEPQALADMFNWAFLPYIWQRKRAEIGVGPYAASSTKSKIGMQMMDRRLSVWSDPVDPNRHSAPFDLIGGRMRHVDWWKDGVLTDLPYGRDYAVQHKLNNGEGLGGIPWIMTGGTTSLDEMIATTRTGFLVTRFHDCYPLETQSLMCTGNTRDGFWYIENGQIKHPAQNFRFNESPFFILNQVESIGPVARTYQELPYSPVAPLIKVRNFNFTSLADAV